jgi:signal transduction histidine kinase
MFRRRLQLALYALAFAAAIQGAVAWWAVDFASTKVLRGRVASDLHTGFIDLLASKQRLRAWVSQALVAETADPQLRERLFADIEATLVRLDSLTRHAARLAQEGGELGGMDTRDREVALDTLKRSMGELRDAIRELPLDGSRVAGSGAEAWERAQRLFDTSQGQDMRAVLAGNIAREELAVARERAAADRSLSLVRGLAFGATLTLALASAVFAVYFTGALRRPLDDLRTGAEALQRGDFGHRIPDLGTDEFAQLARTMNALAHEVEQHRRRETEARMRLEGVVQARTAELQQALHTVQLIDARRRQLFADISHELRTPTTAIRGEAEITLRGRDKPLEEYQAALARIAEASRHLGGVIDDLLAIARSDLDTLSLRRDPVDIEAVLAEALAQARAVARERGIEIEHSGEPDAARLHVAGDPQRLRQTFMILFDNAVSYSHPGGRIRVRTGASTDADDAGLRWWLEVRDEGIGIPAEDVPRVFDRHFRSDRARAHRPDGSGLGLHLAQSLVRAHDGDISIASAPDAGTTLRLQLPAIDAAAVPPDAADRATLPQARRA